MNKDLGIKLGDYDKYYHYISEPSGFYVMPLKVFDELFDELNAWKKENQQLKERIEYLERNNNRREEEITLQRQEIIDLEERIDKAIEYINNLRDESAERQGFYNCFPDDLFIPNIEELLQLLKGDSNE